MVKQSSALADGVQATFISGIAGSGKSFFLKAVEDNLTDRGNWIIIRSKFERCNEPFIEGDTFSHVRQSRESFG